MKNNMRMLDVNSQERGHRGFFTPLVFGSIALFLCMEVGAGDCVNTAGGIGVCVDNREISGMLGIKWNGVEGRTDIYKPLGTGSQTIQNLTFKFSNTTKTRDTMTAMQGSQDFTATVSGTSLEISGSGKKGLQMDDDGNGTLIFALDNNKNKQVKLDLGSHDLEGTQHALKGSLIINSDSKNSVLSNFFGTLSSYILPSSSKSIAFSGFFGGRGILGNLSLGLFNDINLTFGDNASLEGKIILEAGRTSIQSADKTFLLTGGIYSEIGEGTLIFKDTQVDISGFLSSEGNTNGDCAIISNGGIITIQFDQEEQNIAIIGTISAVNKPQSNIVVKTIGEGTLLTLNGVNSDNGTSGVNIRLEGKNSMLILNKKNPDFNFQGSGNIITNFNSTGSKVEGNISFNGSGKNEMFFQENGTINGNITIESPQNYDAENRVTFKQGGDINGNINALSGKNVIIFNTGISQTGGLEVKGQDEAANIINLTSGALTINTINGDSTQRSLYAQNPNGSNVINSNGMLTIHGDIDASAGINQIAIQEQGSLVLGDNIPFTICSQYGKNILSLNSNENNKLNLKTIKAINGENFLGKDLIIQTDPTKTRNLEDLKDTNMFTGVMQVSKGVSAKDGKNTILFSAGIKQESSIIAHIDNSNNSELILKNAISGNNIVFFDVSTSSLLSAQKAIQAYLDSNHSAEDQKRLGENSAIFGDVNSEGGENFIFIKGKNGENEEKSALFGNIVTNGGSNKLILQNSIIMPSAIVSEDGTIAGVGGDMSGNFITNNGETTVMALADSNPLGKKNLAYNLNAKGGNTNLLFAGKINIEFSVKLDENAQVNLTFISSSQQSQYSLQSKNYNDFYQANPNSNQDEGFNIELMGDQRHIYQSKIRSTHTNDSHNLILGGTTMGNITDFAISQPQDTQQQKQQSIILGKKSVFVGNINIGSARVEMQNYSKIFFEDFDNKGSKNKFSLPTLDIKGETHQSPHKDPNATISIISGLDNSFNLLTIGSTNNNNQQSQPKVGTGLQGQSGAMFVVRVNSQADQSSTILGGENISDGNGKQGYAYSDRIIIANIGDNTKAQEGSYYLGIDLGNKKTLTDVKYDPSNDNKENGGGSKQLGNIAVLTTVNTTGGQAGIDLKIRDTIDGFDKISGELTAKVTDINGEVGTSKTGFTTYFLTSLTSHGPTNERNKVSASALAVNYDLYIVMINSLNKRMGELRDNPYSQGVWARIFGGSQSNHFGLGTKTNYVTIQAGYDYAFGFEGANNYLGLALSYSTSNSTVQNSLTQDLNNEVVGFEGVKSHGVEVALYNAYVQDEGWYNDSIFKFSYIASSFAILNQTPLYSTHNLAFTLSDEFGYRFKLGSEKEWYIDPQAEFSFGYFNPNELKQTLGESWLHGIAEGVFTLRTRIGSSFGYDFKKFTQGKAIKASVYVGVFYEYDYVTGGDVAFTTNLGGESNAFGAIGSDKRVVINVGTNMNIKDNTRIYFDFEKSFAGKITTDYQVNVGVRYSFGENNGYTPIDESKKRRLPLRVRDGENHEDEEDYESEEGGNEEFQENVDGAKEGA